MQIKKKGRVKETCFGPDGCELFRLYDPVVDEDSVLVSCGSKIGTIKKYQVLFEDEESGTNTHQMIKDMYYSKDQEMSDDTKTSHYSLLKCPAPGCDYESITQGLLDSHFKLLHKPFGSSSSLSNNINNNNTFTSKNDNTPTIEKRRRTSVDSIIPRNQSRIQHQSGSQIQCKFCTKKFGTTEDMEIHMCIDHSDELMLADAEKMSTGPPNFTQFHYELIAPPKTLQSNQMGYWRGIQGEKNSCYLDCCLMSLFSLHSVFDKYLEPPKTPSREGNLIIERLKTDIINELRTRGFVPSSSVVQWRRMISNYFEGNDFTSEKCYERDVEEFLRFLFQLLCVEPMHVRRLNENSVTNEFAVQLLMSEELRGTFVSVADLWNFTIQSQSFQLVSPSDYMILLIPRFSNKERVLKGVYPTFHLEVSVENSSVRYQLFSVCCIGYSHYINFICDDTMENWYYYDSMSERVHNQSVPIWRKAIGFDKLESVSHEDVLPDSDLKRLFNDASICFYKRVQ